VSEAPPADMRDASDSPAARLFDDLILDNPETPVLKKQLRSRLKGEAGAVMPRSVFSRTQSSRNSIMHTALQRHTRSESARPVTGIDGAVNGATTDASPGIPAKRRRGRPCKKPQDVTSSVVSESGRTTTSPSPSRPPTRLKRRRIETPESEAPSEHPEDHAEPPDSPAHSDGKLPPPNGLHQKENASPSSPFPSSSGSINNGAYSLRPETTSSMSELDTRSSLAESQPSENEIKAEDADTPLTGITSRHSVPSDDTLVVAEIANGVGHKDSGDSSITRAMHSPISQTTEKESAGQDPVHPSGSVANDLDQYSDMDAEGEPDDEVG